MGTKTRSGDYCYLSSDFTVTHFRCDDYADGTVTDARTGKIVVLAPKGALHGFTRK